MPSESAIAFRKLDSKAPVYNFLMSTAALYRIKQTDKANVLDVSEAARPNGSWDQYASLTTVTASQQLYLLGYNPQSGKLDTYVFTSADPWVASNSVASKVETGKDIINSFTLGNRSHLAIYTAKNGIFEFYSLADDLSLSSALQYFRNHEPAISQGFTTVKFFTIFGQVAMLGYNGITGYVAGYTIGSVASSSGGIPPLAVTPAWAHKWAEGWTRFAFFQFGGANFFLKTNTSKPNVNIDHVNDVLSVGTAEVGSHLTLQDAQTLNNVEPFVLGNGDPYFVTYLKSTGQLTAYRFHSDCLGWTPVATVSAPTNAGLITPITTLAGEVFLFVG
jgi:hypothetical protein